MGIRKEIREGKDMKESEQIYANLNMKKTGENIRSRRERLGMNRPDIPVGAPKSEGGVSLTTWHKTKWTEELPARYPHKTAKTSDASDAVKSIAGFEYAAG